VELIEHFSWHNIHQSTRIVCSDPEQSASWPAVYSVHQNCDCESSSLPPPLAAFIAALLECCCLSCCVQTFSMSRAWNLLIDKSVKNKKRRSLRLLFASATVCLALLVCCLLASSDTARNWKRGCTSGLFCWCPCHFIPITFDISQLCSKPQQGFPFAAAGRRCHSTGWFSTGHLQQQFFHPLGLAKGSF